MKRLLGLGLMVLATGLVASASNGTPASGDNALGERIRHEIVMYPRYSIWDNISFRIVEGNVELLGQVSQPYKKQDLQRLVQRVPGVAGVTNSVEVLPLSHFDDQLRLQVARNIFRDPVLQRYALQAVPNIHIIVDNGKVTLEGIVNNDMEKQVAGIRAGQSMSFGAVVNNLRVERSSRKS